MNVLNRLVMVILVLVIILLVTVIAIVPENSFRLSSTFFEWLRQGSADYQTNDWALFAAGRVVIGGTIVLVCLFVLWLELRKPRKKTIRVQKVAGGEAHITIDSIAQRLAYHIDQLPDVIKVTPHITGRARTMDIELMLETSPDIDVPMKTEEVLQVTREIVAERMGLKLGKVQVKIKHAPYPKE
ncbi:MAG: hypothetical protein KKD28_11640 [Chloroflexi bacterium]|nr:hypothetical protein [Chloroflexota bacterium]